MLLPRKHVESHENAIERRLVETLVSGGVRPFHRAGSVRKSSAMGTGLFLVKPAMAGARMEFTSHSEQLFAARAASARPNADRLAKQRGGPAQVIRMPDREKQARQETVLGWMAALGPMLWLGHAALVWLKVV